MRYFIRNMILQGKRAYDIISHEYPLPQIETIFTQIHFIASANYSIIKIESVF